MCCYWLMYSALLQLFSQCLCIWYPLSLSLLFSLTCRLAQQGLEFTITMYSYVEIVQLLHPLNHFNYCSWSLTIFWLPFIQSPFFFTALIFYFELLEIWRNGTSFSFHFLDEIGNMNFCSLWCSRLIHELWWVLTTISFLPCLVSILFIFSICPSTQKTFFGF